MVRHIIIRLGNHILVNPILALSKILCELSELSVSNHVVHGKEIILKSRMITRR